MTAPEIRTLARRISDSEHVLLHTGPALLDGTDLPVDSLARAVWSDDARFTLDRFESEPERVWADWLAFWDDATVDPATVSTEPVHERVAELVERNHVTIVVTENVFGKLREAGVPSGQCIEFHGRVDEARCGRCYRRYDVEPARTTGNQRCQACGGTLGPGIVLANEPPAKADRLLAWSHAEKCDLYVAAGTDLTVHPTVENAQRALETGGELAIVSDERTALDEEADVKLAANPTSVLAKLRDVLAILG